MIVSRSKEKKEKSLQSYNNNRYINVKVTDEKVDKRIM